MKIQKANLIISNVSLFGDAVCRAIELGVVEDSQIFAQD